MHTKCVDILQQIDRNIIKQRKFKWLSPPPHWHKLITVHSTVNHVRHEIWHSPSVAAFSGLQREVNFRASGQGQQHFGNI